MQTFLPYPDFAESAEVLDNKRLGKQRIEAIQILKALAYSLLDSRVRKDLGMTELSRWIKHPAVRMWRGYELALADYGLTICTQWIERGFRDSCWDKINEIRDVLAGTYKQRYFSAPKPFWFGNAEFHQSHRSNLLRKDPEFYGKYGWVEPLTLPYVWPV
jgi:hypothetical protein